jgi:hypothetical protein
MRKSTRQLARAFCFSCSDKFTVRTKRSPAPVAMDNNLLASKAEITPLLEYSMEDSYSGETMPNLYNDKPLETNVNQQIPTSHSENEEHDDTTFQLAESDPARADNRGGMASEAGNEGKVGFRDDNSTVGLVAPSGNPGGDVGPGAGTSDAGEPRIEMSSLGVVDANVVDLSDANDAPRDADDEEDGA